MSGLLAGRIWQSDLHPDLKPLAAALADIGNDDGTSIYPSVAYMAWLLGRSTRSIQENLSRLRAQGVLVVVSGGTGGRSKSTEYRLLEASLPYRDPWRNHAGSSWFPRNHEACDTKPRSLRRETTNPSSPEPSSTVSKAKPRAEASRAITHDAETIRRIEEKSKRLQREGTSRVEAQVGVGPSDDGRKRMGILNFREYEDYSELRARKQLPDGVRTFSSYLDHLEKTRPGFTRERPANPPREKAIGATA